MVPRAEPGGFFGRQVERERLWELVSNVAAGRGRSILVEGEPGIGKSALLTAALAAAPGEGCEVAWAAADELSQRFPLWVLLDCLGVGRGASSDPERAQIAAVLSGGRAAEPGGPAAGPAGLTGLLADGDSVRAATELLLALVERWCEASPLVLVVDDLQWADEASLEVWRRLAEAVEQMPLLLAGAYRPVPRRDAVERLRRTVQARDGLVIALRPLPEPAVIDLVADLVGGVPGPHLRELAGRAAGNPLYVRELVDVLLREDGVTAADGVVELVGAVDRTSTSLGAAVARRLEFLSPAASEALRIAALLGVRFSVVEVATVLDRAKADLAAPVKEATAAGVVAESGGWLAFRHPLVWQALYEGISPPVRAALHRHAARALAAAGAAPVKVASQLVTAPGAMDPWTLDWLVASVAELVNRAPQIADELLRRAVDRLPADDPRRARFAADLAGLLFRLGRNADAETYARTALADVALAPRMRYLLGYLAMRTGRIADALTGLHSALGDPELPDGWRARLLSLASMIRAGTGSDLDAAEKSSREALALGEAAGDRYAAGCALHALATVYAVRRDEAGRLDCVDRALHVIGDDPDCTDLRLAHLANRMYSLSVQDRMGDAEATLVALRALAERIGDARLVSFHHPAATLYFFLGRWDDALAELGVISDVPEDSSLTGMVHGLAALIAARRDDRAAASAHLRAVRDEPLDTPRARANSLPLLTARAVTAERDGDRAAALDVLRPLVGSDWAQSERHLLLPELVRLAVAAGDLDAARHAAETCTVIAASAPTASRRAAAERCRGMLDGDPAPVLAAADHYREVGRVPELGQALEDAAVLLAGRGETASARAAFASAAEIYVRLGAAWDLRRAAARIRPYGIRQGSRGPRRRPRYGWEALTTTERTIAALVAKGRSNPDIAAELLLSRRTVQSHVSHILAKLSAKSRVEIAREAVQAAKVNTTSRKV